MTSYFDFANHVLSGESLEDKLIDVDFEWTEWKEFRLPEVPGRKERLTFSKVQLKFPKATALNESNKKALAIHSFANHELLATEMMAAALLVFPHRNEEELRFKKGIYKTLKDEQKHLALYLKRLNELGYELGDFPLNDFFWRQMEKLKTPAEYAAVMALTLEAANLDFAQYYSGIFREIGDPESAEILDVVLEDEITHVAFGHHWMNRWRQDKDLWTYYLECLPWPMTPARSKGLGFDPLLHLRAMDDEDFVRRLSAFNDDFRVTRRK